jgi:vacuolar-type H+-ATPase subunit D/Vma8
MTLKYTQYIAGADVEAVKACIAVIRPLYDQYTPASIAEAHHQIRRELDMIVERAEKAKRIQKLIAEMEDTE